MADMDRQRVKDLFLAALDLRPGDRAPFLDAECNGESEIRSEVESLLAANDEAAGFLDEPAPLHVLAELGPELPSPVDTLPGSRVGPYRIEAAIGDGGMGTVYRACRDDETFAQIVAIKVLHRDLDRGAMLRRFQAERQILANLEHPNIARLLDAGVTPDGRSYLVLEFIEGKPLNAYAEDNGLSVRQKLELFGQVCAAVQCAHQRLVVHRDLKPANILVTKAGVPKLLDFGIAKLLADAEADRTVTGMHLMTPAYASPEQIRAEAITTASDIYSLGVLLYELLTGNKPLKLPTGDPLAAARMITDQEPVVPSATVPSLAGDLDNIVLKALSKEPNRRYGSAREFAEDIQRYLDGLPVAARTPTLFYLARKYVRRHSGRLAAAAAVLIVLVAGVVSTLREGRRAQARFNDVRELSKSVLFEIHDAVRTLPGSTAARELIISRALTFLDKLSAEAGSDLALQRELGDGYMRLGEVQGATGTSNLGRTAAARTSYGKALAWREAVARALPNDPSALRDLANTHDALSSSYQEAGELGEAGRHEQQALALRQKIVAAYPQELAKSYFSQAQSRVVAGDFARALELHREALKLWDQAAGPFLRSRSIAHKRIGGVLIRLNRLEEAEEHYEAAIRLDQERLRQAPGDLEITLDMSYAQSDLALIWQLRKNIAKANEYASTALAARETVLAADPSNVRARSAVASALGRVARNLWALDRKGEAITKYEQALALRLATVKDSTPSVGEDAAVAELHGQLGAAYKATGQPNRARPHVEAAIKLYQAVRTAWPERDEYRVALEEQHSLLVHLP